MPIVLDGGAAAGRIHDDRIEAVRELGAPGIYVVARERLTLVAAAHMQGPRATTAAARRDHALAAVALQQPKGRRIDVAIERLLGTARQQGDTQFSGALCRIRSGFQNFAVD